MTHNIIVFCPTQRSYCLDFLIKTMLVVLILFLSLCNRLVSVAAIASHNASSLTCIPTHYVFKCHLPQYYGYDKQLTNNVLITIETFIWILSFVLCAYSSQRYYIYIQSFSRHSYPERLTVSTGTFPRGKQGEVPCPRT